MFPRFVPDRQPAFCLSLRHTPSEQTVSAACRWREHVYWGYSEIARARERETHTERWTAYENRLGLDKEVAGGTGKARGALL